MIYSYSVLRYVHDTSAEEFLNLGVVVLAPVQGFLKFRFLDRWERVQHCFPDANISWLQEMCSHLQKNLQKTEKRGCWTLRDWLDWVLPKDDSALQWRILGMGRDEREPEEQLHHLFCRMCPGANR